MVLLVVLVLVMGAPEPRQPVDWRPWRRPHPARGTVALGLSAAALVWFFVTDLSREAVRFELRAAVAFTLVLASDFVQPGDGKRRWGPWIFRVFFVGFVIYWWWQTYRAMSL